KGAARIDEEFAVAESPVADGVVVLQPEAERVHPVVARGAFGARPVAFQLFAQGGDGADGGLVQQRNVGGRRRRWRSQDIFQHVLAAQHRRRARGIAGYSEHTGLAEYTAALIGAEFDAPEIRASDAVDAVKLR